MVKHLNNSLERNTRSENSPIDELTQSEGKKKSKKDLRKKAYYELQKKEKDQLIAEMILYCSPEFEAWNENEFGDD